MKNRQMVKKIGKDIRGRLRIKRGRISLLFILSLCILFTACGDRKPSTKEVSIKEIFRPDKDLQLGNLSKTGWQMEVGPTSFGEEGEITMTVLSQEDSESLRSEDLVFYGSPIEINYNEEKNVRLQDTIELKVQIPKDYIKEMEAESLFFATYYDGQWELGFPKAIDLDKGIASIDIHHFSFWAFGKGSEDKQIQEFAKKFAALQYENQNSKKFLKDRLERQYDDLFKSIGVNSSSIRSQLTLDMINYLEDANIDSGGISPIASLANMASAISKGKAGRVDFNNHLLEFTGKALYFSLERDPAKFSSLANVTGGLSKAAGALAEGDNRGALEGIADILRGSNPLVALADSALTAVKEKMEETISIWEKGELEKAYKIYTGRAVGRYGYDSDLAGNIDEIFIVLGGGSRAFERNIVKKYQDKFGDEVRSKEDILAAAREHLARSFNEREKAEKEILEIQKREEAFLGYVKAEGLLKAHNYKKYFGLDGGGKFDIADRLKRIYAIRETVLASMDKDQSENISDEFLVRAMNQWIFWSEQGDREGFFKYMRENGYIKEPYKGDPEYAWVLVDTIDFEDIKSNENHEYKSSGTMGSYNGSVTWIGEQIFTYKVGGGLATQASFSGIPSVIRPDQPVVLEMDFSTESNDVLNLYFISNASADFDTWDLGLGTRSINARVFQNSDGKNAFTIHSDKGASAYKEKLTASLGAGREKGDKIALRLRFSITGSSRGSNYIYEWQEID